MLATRARMAAAGAAGGLELTDTFTDSNGTAIAAHTPDVNTVGNSYADLLGTCTIQSNTANCDDAGNIVAVDIGTDGGFVISLSYTPSGSLATHGGIIVRCDGSNNTYFVIGNDNGGTNFIIAWRNGGGLTNVASTAFTFALDTTYTIELTLNSSNGFTATLNGGNTLNATSSQLAGNNQIGFRGRSGASIDNLSVLG